MNILKKVFEVTFSMQRVLALLLCLLCFPLFALLYYFYQNTIDIQLLATFAEFSKTRIAFTLVLSSFVCVFLATIKVSRLVPAYDLFINNALVATGNALIAKLLLTGSVVVSIILNNLATLNDIIILNELCRITRR